MISSMHVPHRNHRDAANRPSTSMPTSPLSPQLPGLTLPHRPLALRRQPPPVLRTEMHEGPVFCLSHQAHLAA